MQTFTEFRENPIDEAAIEWIDKDNKDAAIAVMDRGSYLVMKQKDYDNKTDISFLVDKKQIDSLIKILQKLK